MRTFFNHEWLESVEGFITLEVTGREDLKVALDSQESVFDGSYLRSKRVPARTIVVRFAIECAREDYHDKLEELKRIINTSEEEALLFDDEDDKFFGAILKEVDIDKEFQTAVTGKLTFACMDPYKYANTKKHFPAIDGKIVINNLGNVPASIDYQVVIKENETANTCGYIGLISDKGSLEYGLVEGTKTGPAYYFLSRNAQEFITRHESSGSMSGTLEERTIGPYKYACPAASTGDGWHGVSHSASLAIPDKDISVFANISFFAETPEDMGVFEIILGTAEVTDWLRFRIRKSTTSSVARALIWDPVNNREIKGVNFSVIGNENLFNPTSVNPIVEIMKKGPTITFNAGGFVVSISGSEYDQVVKVVRWGMFDYSTEPTMKMGVKEYYVKIFNRDFDDHATAFLAGDILTINGEEARMLKNGHFSRDDEIIGSTYFKADVGRMEIDVKQSTWAAPVEVDAYIRERWV